MSNADTLAARLQIQGLVWGSPYIELADTTAIVSDTGYIANIEYKGKGWVSGKAHSFKAVLSHNGKTVRSYEGNWTAIGKVSKTDEVFTDATVPKTEVTVKPIEQQGDWESRRLWAATAQGIRSGDYESASRDKSRIEVSLPNCPPGSSLTSSDRTNNDKGARTRPLRVSRGS